MPNQSELFDRRFVDRDEVVFKRLVQGLVGQPCVAWRKSYGRTGSLHFGRLIASPAAPARAVYHDRGLWVVDLWDCDRLLTLAAASEVDSRRNGDDVVLERLGNLYGATVRGIDVDPKSLSLAISFNNGVKLELLPDLQSDENDEQWAIELPIGQALVAFGKRRWALQENS